VLLPLSIVAQSEPLATRPATLHRLSWASWADDRTSLTVSQRGDATIALVVAWPLDRRGRPRPSALEEARVVRWELSRSVIADVEALHHLFPLDRHDLLVIGRAGGDPRVRPLPRSLLDLARNTGKLARSPLGPRLEEAVLAFR